MLDFTFLVCSCRMTGESWLVNLPRDQNLGEVMNIFVQSMMLFYPVEI